MVLDYFDLKKAVAPLIDMLDHSFMIDEHDDVLCQFFDAQSDLKHVKVPFSSTAENIAVWVAKTLAEQFASYQRIHSITVTVCETRTSTATVTLTVPVGT
jgi:6-pyruvoyl-tetrahydropterin synthase